MRSRFPFDARSSSVRLRTAGNHTQCVRVIASLVSSKQAIAFYTERDKDGAMKRRSFQFTGAFARELPAPQRF